MRLIIELICAYLLLARIFDDLIHEYLINI